MGGCQSNDTARNTNGSGSSKPASMNTTEYMFHRFDKDKSGFITLDNLKAIMRDDKTHFGGGDAEHIMNKYGTNGKMSLAQFQNWWNSTYTTYNDDAMLAKLVDEVTSEETPHLDTIVELPSAPHNSNVAISRS